MYKGIGSPALFTRIYKNRCGLDDDKEGVWRVYTLRQKPVEAGRMVHRKQYGKGEKCACGIKMMIFCGSGSTLIACEATGKHGRMMELSTHYCDVIIKRWQDFTGKQATLESNGKTYNELSNDNQAQKSTLI